MMNIVKCRKCNHQSIIDMNEEKEGICGVCGAGHEYIEVVDSVENVMPSPEEIAKGFKFGM